MRVLNQQEAKFTSGGTVAFFTGFAGGLENVNKTEILLGCAYAYAIVGAALAFLSLPPTADKFTTTTYIGCIGATYGFVEGYMGYTLGSLVA
jgi:hypothetical protein